MRMAEEIREFLAEEPFAVVAVGLDLGQGEEAVLLVKTRRDVAEALKGAGAPVEAGWAVEATEHGPVACWLVRCEAPGAGELLGEVYFDPEDPADRDYLRRLAGQAEVRVGFLDEDLEPVWLAQLQWDEARRLEAEQVLDRLEELLERCESADFEAAKAAFQEAHPLDALVERLFPG
ncbi:hypothetical protein [Deferrisoma palaeochoriense]